MKRKIRLALGRLGFSLCLMACTMPLPIATPASPTPPPGVGLPDNPIANLNGKSSFVQELTPLQASYKQKSLSYLDLNTCFPDRRDCFNQLFLPLSSQIRYDFFFSDGSPVIGQNPVFNLAESIGQSSPFRRVIRVTVPDGYRANTIRSAEDLLASRFRTEDLQQVQNNPVLSQTAAVPEGLLQGEAWSQNQKVNYLELGDVPYSAPRNQLGFGVVYFLLNHDRSPLPSRPQPIFDSAPGDLLYSPIRQVFRVLAVDPVNSLLDDPARQIRSQEDLLNAINRGVFQLEETQDFFNYPVLAQNVLSPEQSTEIFALKVSALGAFPTLPANRLYTLWASNQLNQARLLLRFRSQNGVLVAEDQGKLEPGKAIFRFSQAELNRIRHFLLTIEEAEAVQPTGSTLLELSYNGQRELNLAVPFAERYSALQTGQFLLADPRQTPNPQHNAGFWLAQRTDNNTSRPPLNADLDPGLILSLPPRGWVYKSWVRVDQSTAVWLDSGAFREVNQADQSLLYSEKIAYRFPGELFVQNAPAELFFPLNLVSTGERELVVSLEPDNIEASSPYFIMFRRVLDKNLPALRNQDLPAQKINFPGLELRLESDKGP